MAEVPLARHAGRVTLLLEDLGHRHFVRMDTDARARPERTVNADAVVVTASEQRGARRGTDRLRDMEVGELAAFLRHSVEVRRGVGFAAERADVRVAEVVAEDDDDVGQTRHGRGGNSRGEHEHDEEGAK